MKGPIVCCIFALLALVLVSQAQSFKLSANLQVQYFNIDVCEGTFGDVRGVFRRCKWYI